MTSITLRGQLEHFFVWERKGIQGAETEASKAVAFYIEQNGLLQQPVDKGSVPYMLALSEKLHKDRIIAGCVTCEHFDHNYEMCRLAGMRPPAKVIAYGCPSWQDEELPF